MAAKKKAKKKAATKGKRKAKKKAGAKRVRGSRAVPAKAAAGQGNHKAYWHANLRVISVLLAVWAVAGIGLGILLVEPLNHFRVGGYPLGFWFAQQGSIFVFIGLIYLYARWMEAVDDSYGVSDKGGRR